MAKKQANLYWKPEVLRDINNGFNANWFTSKDFCTRFDIHEKRDIEQYSIRLLRLFKNNWLNRKRKNGFQKCIS